MVKKSGSVKGSLSVREVSVIKRPSALQGHSSQGTAVSHGAQGVPISLGHTQSQKSLAYKDKGQSWPGGHSLQSKSAKGYHWSRPLRGHNQSQWGPAKRGVTVGQRSQPVWGPQGDHGLEALCPVVQNPLPSLHAHLTSSVALHTLFPSH